MQKKTIIIIVVAIVAVFFIVMVAGVVVGYYIVHKAIQKESITDKHLDKQDGKIEFNGGKIEVGKAAEWPADMPSDVPKFTYGKVKMVTKSEVENKKAWNVILEDISADAAEKYKEDLKNSGWGIKATTTVSGQGGSIMAEQDKLQLFIMIDSDKHTASIGVNEKS